MAAAVDFFATQVDEIALLDYLGEPRTVNLYPWPINLLVPAAIDRRDLDARPSVMVVSDALGSPRLIRAPADASMDGGSASATFNRINWDRLQPAANEGLVDSNGSPVLLWQRGLHVGNVLHQSQIGSQADSMHGVSREYERWVNRVMSWVRRRGTRVWGLEGAKLRPDLDINIDHISSIYALPGALAELEAGGQGRR